MPYKNQHSARQLEPDDFESDGMGKGIQFKTIKIADGITAIVGKLKKPPKDSNADSTHIQTYRFDKDKFTEAEAKAWLKKHNLKIKKFEKAVGTKNEQLLNEGDDMPDTEKNELYVKIPNSFEEMREKLGEAISKSGLFGAIKNEWNVSIEATFPEKVIVVNSTEDENKYYQADWSLNKDGDVVFSNVKSVEVNAVIKVKNEQAMESNNTTMLNEDIQATLLLEEVVNPETGKSRYIGKAEKVQRGDYKNKNKRIYPDKILDEGINDLQQRLKQGASPIYKCHRTKDGQNVTDLDKIVGGLNEVSYHPDTKTVDLDEIEFAETLDGKDIIALAKLKKPIQFQFSQRGKGTSHFVKNEKNEVAEIIDSVYIDGFDILRAGTASVEQPNMEFQVLTEETEMLNNRILTEDEVTTKIKAEREAIKAEILNEMRNAKPEEKKPEDPPKESPKEVDKSAVVLNEMKTQMAKMNEAIEETKKEKAIVALTKSAEAILDEELKDEKYKTFTADGKKHITEMTLKHAPELYGKVDVNKPDELKAGVVGMLNEHYEEVAKFMADTRLAGMGYPKPGGTGIQSVQVVHENIPNMEMIKRLEESVEGHIDPQKKHFQLAANDPAQAEIGKVMDSYYKENYRALLNESNEEFTLSDIGVKLATVNAVIIPMALKRLTALKYVDLMQMKALTDYKMIETINPALSANIHTNVALFQPTENGTLSMVGTEFTAYPVIATEKGFRTNISFKSIAAAKNSSIDPVGSSIAGMVKLAAQITDQYLWELIIAKAQAYDFDEVDSAESLTQVGSTREWQSLYQGWIKYELVKDTTNANPTDAKLVNLFGTPIDTNTMQEVVVAEYGGDSTAMTYGTDYTVNWADGSVTLTDAGETKRNSNGVSAKYSYTSNAKFWSVSGGGSRGLYQWLMNLQQKVGQAKVAIRQRNYKPDFAIFGITMEDLLSKGPQFNAEAMQPGTAKDALGNVMMYDGLPVEGVDWAPECWGIVGVKGMAVHGIQTPLAVTGPIEDVLSSGSFYKLKGMTGDDLCVPESVCLVGVTDLASLE
jgi:hypothetical protein